MRRIQLFVGALVAVGFASPRMGVAQKAAAGMAGGSKVAPHVSAQKEAHVQMRDAIAVAHAKKQGVLIKFSASWCGPCHAFDRFLYDTTGVGAIMQKYFVIVGMTALEMTPNDSLNTPGAVQLAREMGGDIEHDTGIPYFFMLNGDGQKTGDSKNMPDKSNIGDPATKVEVEQFDLLLQTTAPTITASERARIKKFLDAASGRP